MAPILHSSAPQDSDARFSPDPLHFGVSSSRVSDSSSPKGPYTHSSVGTLEPKNINLFGHVDPWGMRFGAFTSRVSDDSRVCLAGNPKPLPSNNERQHKSHANLKSETPMHITPQSLLLKSYALQIQSPNRLRVSRLASSLKPRTLHPTYSQALPGETEDFGEATDELIRFKRVHQVTTGLRVQGCFSGCGFSASPCIHGFRISGWVCLI